MKKKISFLLFLLLLIPFNVSAITINEFEQQVKKYTDELTEKQNKIAKNDKEVAEVKAKINEIQNQMAEIEADMIRLQKDIDDGNEKIKEKNKEIKNLIKYSQVVDSKNSYLEYIFGAESFTDLIFRLSVIEQLADYDKKVTNELQELIKANNEKKEELKNKQSDLDKLKDKLSDEKSRIEADTDAIRESMPSIEERIKEAKTNLEYYKKLGCGKSEDIQACQYRIEQSHSSVSIPAAEGFRKPTDQGKISQAYRGISHLGYDIVSTTSNKSIPIYPVANGQVFKIYYDNCTSGNWCSAIGHSCNGNALVVKIRHNIGGRYIYSTYAHFSSFGNIKEGQLVTTSTIIGYMGTTGCSTGPHLHLELTKCDWHTGGGCTYDTYQKSSINPALYIGIPNTYGYTW